MTRSLFAILLVLLLTLASTTPAYALSSKDVEVELMCQCGCTMVLDVCECDTASQMRTKITEMISQGKNKQQIVAYFVSQYGEKVLSAPTKKGFNLTAWVVPFAAVIVGGVVLYLVLKTWSRRGRGDLPTPASSLVSPEDADQYREQMRDELRRFKEEESS